MDKRPKASTGRSAAFLATRRAWRLAHRTRQTHHGWSAVLLTSEGRHDRIGGSDYVAVTIDPQGAACALLAESLFSHGDPRAVRQSRDCFAGLGALLTQTEPRRPLPEPLHPSTLTHLWRAHLRLVHAAITQIATGRAAPHDDAAAPPAPTATPSPNRLPSTGRPTNAALTAWRHEQHTIAWASVGVSDTEEARQWELHRVTPKDATEATGWTLPWRHFGMQPSDVLEWIGYTDQEAARHCAAGHDPHHDGLGAFHPTARPSQAHTTGEEAYKEAG